MIDPVATALSVSSREEMISFLFDLARRARAGNAPVENDTSLDLIEAAASWSEGMDDFLRARGEDVESLSPWPIVAMIFSAGLVYE